MRFKGRHQIITLLILLPIDIGLIVAPVAIGALTPMELGAWTLAAAMLVGLLVRA